MSNNKGNATLIVTLIVGLIVVVAVGVVAYRNSKAHSASQPLSLRNYLPASTKPNQTSSATTSAATVSTNASADDALNAAEQSLNSASSSMTDVNDGLNQQATDPSQ